MGNSVDGAKEEVFASVDVQVAKFVCYGTLIGVLFSASAVSNASLGHTVDGVLLGIAVALNIGWNGSDHSTTVGVPLVCIGYLASLAKAVGSRSMASQQLFIVLITILCAVAILATALVVWKFSTVSTQFGGQSAKLRQSPKVNSRRFDFPLDVESGATVPATVSSNPVRNRPVGTSNIF